MPFRVKDTVKEQNMGQIDHKFRLSSLKHEKLQDDLCPCSLTYVYTFSFCSR